MALRSQNGQCLPNEQLFNILFSLSKSACDPTALLNKYYSNSAVTSEILIFSWAVL